MAQNIPQADELYINDMIPEIYRIICADDAHVWVKVLDLKHDRFYGCRHYSTKHFLENAIGLDADCFLRDFAKGRLRCIRAMISEIERF